MRDSVNNYDHIKNSDISNMIDEWIKSERDRKILKRRLIDGVCFEPLADEFQLSVSQTKRIIYRCENELFKHFEVKHI